MHARGTRKSQRRNHAARAWRSDQAARMQDVGEDPACTAKGSGKGVGNRTEDEGPRRQLGKVRDHRLDQIPEIELAGLHELADCILGGREGPDQRLADIAANVARLGSVVSKRGGHRTPPGCGLIGPIRRRSPGVARSRASRCSRLPSSTQSWMEPKGPMYQWRG